MRSLSLLVASGALAACTVTPSVVLQYPDPGAELEAAELSVYALPGGADCSVLMSGASPEGALANVTAKLPLNDAARLGRLPRGPTVFFAEVRDQAMRPFLRACRQASAGGEVLLELQRLNRPPEFTAPTSDLRVREGEVLDVTVTAVDPDGTAVKLSASNLPPFVTFDASTGRLRAVPGPADQATHTLTLEAAEDTPAGAVTRRAQALVVEDMARPMKWERLYRGWHGRFDAAALWDSANNQLITSYGRDVGFDLQTRAFYAPSTAADVLNDWRVLSFDTPVPDWRPHRVTRPGTGGKYAHAMGIVRSQPSGARIGFAIGGSDGAQISAESLVLDLRRPVIFGSPPMSLQSVPSGASFYSGMAVAIDSDESKSYLFGGDISGSLFTNELREVTARDNGSSVTLMVNTLPASLFPRPTPRSLSAMVVAHNPRRLVVIGGRNTDITTGDPTYDDAWVICLEEQAPKCPPGTRLQWHRVVNTGATFPGSGVPGVFALVAGYDAPRDRVLTYGGIGIVGTMNQAWLFEDVFELDLSAAAPADGGIAAPFRKLPDPGGPYGLVGAAAAQDADGGRLLIYGGVTGRIYTELGAGLDLLDDVWVLGLTPGNEKLTRLATVGGPSGPSRRTAATLTSKGRPLLLGGDNEDGRSLDEWRVEPDGGVTPITLPGQSPWPRAHVSTVYNPDLNEHWLYGGKVKELLPNPSLFRLSDAGFTKMDHVDSQGLPMEPRWGPAAVYDTRNKRMVMFGGIGPLPGGGGSGKLRDVFALSVEGGTLHTTHLQPAGEAPAPRFGSVAGYDPVGQRMILFGGTAAVIASDVDTNEVWELSLVPGQERWRLINATGARPDGMFLPAGVLTREQPPNLYVLGTITRGMRTAFVDKIWRLTLDRPDPAWVELTRPDFRPQPRGFPAIAYDEVGHRLLLAAGASQLLYRHDVWALTLP